MMTEGSETDGPPCGDGVGGAKWGTVDWGVLVGLAAAAVVAFTLLVRGDGGTLTRLALAAPRDRYFQADCPEMLEDMVDLGGRHARGGLLHPIFCGLALPSTNVLIKALDVGWIEAVWILQGIAGAAAVALLYYTQRTLGVPRTGAALVGMLGISSAAFLFWQPLPETYPLGSLSLVVGFAVAARACRARIPAVVHVAAGTLGLGVTITNWMVALATLAVFEPRRRAVVLAAATLAVVYGIWSVEALSLAKPPLTPMSPRNVKRYSSRFLLHPDAGGPIPILRTELITPIMAPPPIAIDPLTSRPPQKMVSFQKSSIFGGGPLAVAAALTWLTVLGLGLHGLAAGSVDPRFRLILGAVLAAQVVLHLLHGEETFLYALHFLPILLLVAAMGTTTRRRRLVEALLVATIALAVANNLGRLRQTVEFPLPPPAAMPVESSE